MAWKIKRNIRTGGFLRGYFINGQYAPTANYGDTITYSVSDSSGKPVVGQVWLEQYINGSQSFNGPFSVPMAPYTLSSHDRAGDYISRAYTLINGQRGSLIEESSIEVQVGGTVSTPAVPGAGPIGNPTAPPPPQTPFNIPIQVNVPMPAPVPGSPGGAPAAGGGPTFGGSCLTTVYRFVLQNPDGSFATGSNRSGCSSVNSANCDPQLFGSLSDVLAYASHNGETPYQVLTASEPWDIIACKIPVDPSRIIGGGGIPWWVWAGAAFVGYKLLSKRS